MDPARPARPRKVRLDATRFRDLPNYFCLPLCRDRPGRLSGYISPEAMVPHRRASKPFPSNSNLLYLAIIGKADIRLCRHALSYPLSRIFVRRVKRILRGTCGPDRCPLTSTSCRGRASMVLMSKPQNLSNSSVAGQHSRHPMKRRTRGV